VEVVRSYALRTSRGQTIAWRNLIVPQQAARCDMKYLIALQTCCAAVPGALASDPLVGTNEDMTKWQR
jgi:hypothetical protein